MAQTVKQAGMAIVNAAVLALFLVAWLVVWPVYLYRRRSI